MRMASALIAGMRKARTMGRKKFKNELSDYLKDSFWLSTFLEVCNITGNVYFDYENDHLWPVLVGVGYISFRRFVDNRPPARVANYALSFGRVTTGLPRRTHRASILARMAPMLSSKTIKYREPENKPLGEFYWDIKIPERVNFVTVRETRLLKFCQQAFERQQRGYTHPMSRTYFLGELHWPDATYKACTSILQIYNLVEGRVQGSSGRLIHPPAPTVRYAKYAHSPTM